MRKLASIIFLLFIGVILYYVMTLPPKDITLEDLSTSVAPYTSPQNESATQETTLIDSSETDNDNKVLVDYYIIVESFRNLTMAQQKAEKLKNDFNTNIIILPPTKEGYYRISYGKYSSLEEARSTIKSIRTKISSDVWIFSEKK